LQARKGGVPKERVLNCMSLAAMTRFFAGRARSRGAGAQRIRQPRHPALRGAPGKPARPQARKTTT
jgi:hypothetical protein